MILLILTKKRYENYQNYSNSNLPVFKDWKCVITKPRSNGKSGSEVNLTTEIGSFTFEKFGFRTN